MSITVDTSHPAAAQIVHFTVHVHTDNWTEMPSISWGDQMSYGLDGGPTTGWCSTGPHDFTYTGEHAYRYSGQFQFVFGDGYENCPADGHDQMVIIKGLIHVGPGPFLHNGPIQPTAGWSGQMWITNGDPHLVYIQAGGGDNDGWEDTLTVDWGDGSTPWTKSVAPPSVCEPANQSPPRPYAWPVFAMGTGTISHQYPSSGTYTITVSVHSEGCDGSEPQAASITGTVKAFE